MLVPGSTRFNPGLLQKLERLSSSSGINVEGCVFPANVEVYQMMDDGKNRESTFRTPRVPGSFRNLPHPPSFSVMMAKMENRKKRKEISARTRQKHHKLRQCQEETQRRQPENTSYVAEVSDATDDFLPLSALKCRNPSQVCVFHCRCEDHV
eukprot:6274657-Amphidinium_carterae.1